MGIERKHVVRQPAQQRRRQRRAQSPISIEPRDPPHHPGMQSGLHNLAVTRLRGDFTTLRSKHPSAEVRFDETNLFKWTITIDHSFASPYGPLSKRLVLLITFPDTYPMEGPEVKLQHPFYHLNVEQENGAVRLKPLQKWLPSFTASYQLQQIIAVLNQPELGCATPEMEDEYLNHNDRYIDKLQASLSGVPNANNSS